MNYFISIEVRHNYGGRKEKMEKRQLEKFIREYYGTLPSITYLPTGGGVITWGYLESPTDHHSFRAFNVCVSTDGSWGLWTKYGDEEEWRPVKAGYETWFLFIRPDDTSGIGLAENLCSLMGANFEQYETPRH